MIYSNFTGRVAKKAKVIDGVNGQFLSMDMAVNDYSKGEETTQWVRVQSSDPAHLKLVEYFTKGRILTIQGNVKIDQSMLQRTAMFLMFLQTPRRRRKTTCLSNPLRGISFKRGVIP